MSGWGWGVRVWGRVGWPCRGAKGVGAVGGSSADFSLLTSLHPLIDPSLTSWHASSSTSGGMCGKGGMKGCDPFRTPAPLVSAAAHAAAVSAQKGTRM
jgi:hypothetical protein